MDSDDGRSTADDDPTPAFVCPLCGTTFDDDRPGCGRCGSTLVVPVDDRTVYETVLPMCGRYDGVGRGPAGPRSDATGGGDDGTGDPSTASLPLLGSICPLARRAVAWRP